MVIERKYPHPRRGRSCWQVIFFFLIIGLGIYIIARPEPAREAIQSIIPTATPEPTRSATQNALLADLSERDGEFMEAVGYFREALRLDATNPQFYIRLISLLVRIGEAEEALTISEQATVLAPDNDQVWTAVAAAHLANGERLNDVGDSTGADLEYAQAAQAADKAIELNPGNADAFAYKAGGIVFQENAELYDRAQEAADTAILLEPGNALARLYAGYVFTYQGYYNAAREQFQLGIQSDASRVELDIALAYNYFGTGNTPEAILSFQEAISVDPDNATAYDGLAYMYLQLGELPLAKENAQEAVTLDPSMARAYGRLGEAFFKEFNYDRAIDELETAVSLYGDPTDLNARFFNMLATAYIRKDLALCTQATPLFEQVSLTNSLSRESALEGLDECRRAAVESSP